MATTLFRPRMRSEFDRKSLSPEPGRKAIFEKHAKKPLCVFTPPPCVRGFLGGLSSQQRRQHGPE